MAMFNYESEALYQQARGETIPSSPVYIAECKKEMIDEASPNYPQLVEYEKEWLNFAKHFYHEGTPVPLEYQKVNTYDYASVENAIPFYYKSAMLKGQTLVNVIHSKRDATSICTDYNLSFIDKTKTYFIKFNSSHIINQIGILADNGLWNVVNRNVTLTNGYITLKPDESLEVFGLRMRYDGQIDDGSIPTIDVICVEYQEGMENWDIPYFEGMKSVQMPVLTTTGKNLFNKEAFYNDWKSKVESYVYKEIVDNEEVLKINNFYHLFDDNKGFRINVKKGVPLTVRMECKKAGTETTNAVFTIRYSDNIYESFPECKSDEWETKTTTFVPTRDYITICSGYNNDDYYYVKNIQLEEGSVATSYEPHKSNILSTPSDFELRGFGDVRDEINLMTGEVTKRIGEIVFNGSKDYRLGGGGNDNYLEFVLPTKAKQASVICDKLFTPTLIHIDNTEYIRATENGFIGYILKSRLSTPDIEGLKAWLSSNNVTVQYQLATESIKTLDFNPYNKPYEEANHYQVSSNTIPPQLLLSVPVVSKGNKTLNDIITEE